ncbi:hypothetical protein GGR08_000583 [Bartonella fuyuanensis]|uniref:Uncharacterized protein n=1 Tax=Bartonella fuyuanensis TaxID=1460968 RepID=A0A840DTJ3_9HYPH|nr:hypothetical protein [Bartonella fuyuanensis]
MVKKDVRHVTGQRRSKNAYDELFQGLRSVGNRRTGKMCNSASLLLHKFNGDAQ